jgi:hypothetical protein
MKQPARNVWAANASGYSLERAAKLAGIGEGLLILWIETGRFKPMELTPPDVFEEFDPVPFQYRHFLVTNANLRDLRRLVENSAPVREKAKFEHVKGTNWTLKELADKWGLSTDTIRDTFKNESGILKFERPAVKGKRPKRAYTTFTIPEDVVERVEKRRRA